MASGMSLMGSGRSVVSAACRGVPSSEEGVSPVAPVPSGRFVGPSSDEDGRPPTGEFVPSATPSLVDIPVGIDAATDVSAGGGSAGGMTSGTGPSGDAPVDTGSTDGVPADVSIGAGQTDGTSVGSASPADALARAASAGVVPIGA